MGYISTERVAEIRAELKEKFPAFKFSVRKNRSSVYVTILEGPVALTIKTHQEQVGTYWLGVEKDPVRKDLLIKIYEIVDRGVTYRETGDYGMQPSHYSHVHIGEWNKPYRITAVNQKGKPVAGLRVKAMKLQVA